MLGNRGLKRVALLGVSLMLACGGGEAGQQEAASGEPAMSETPASEGMASQQGAALPEGVTAEMVAEGKTIFGGAGLCSACHGAEGEGIPGLGANLKDDEWLHNDGSFEGIIETIKVGVDASKSSTGTPMPPKGGSTISDDQVKAVAAFVLTLGK